MIDFIFIIFCIIVLIFCSYYIYNDSANPSKIQKTINKYDNDVKEYLKKVKDYESFIKM